MMTYQFKVGDRGKTIIGSWYTITKITDEKIFYLVDGGIESSIDLKELKTIFKDYLTPKKIIKVKFYYCPRCLKQQKLGWCDMCINKDDDLITCIEKELDVEVNDDNN